jgi:hypothetical protein
MAMAELELLSSTSDATSELWTEEGIVRQPGHSGILELVAYRSKTLEPNPKPDGVELVESNDEIHLGDLGDVCSGDVLKAADKGRSKLRKRISDKLGLSRPILLRAEQLAKQPPNLILNVHGALPRSRDLQSFAVIGALIQLVAITIPAFITYHWRTPKATGPVDRYAYPTFLAGSCFLIAGIALCSYIIEATTVEQVFEPTGNHEVKTIFRLQLERTMGDQPFQTYVIVNEQEDNSIRTSRYDPSQTRDDDDQLELAQADERSVFGNTSTRGSEDTIDEDTIDEDTIDEDTIDEDTLEGATAHHARWWHVLSFARHTGKTTAGTAQAANAANTAKTAKTSSVLSLKAQKLLVVIAVAFTFIGYISQFFGLRGLHWSATFLQLGITLIMTGIRAWARRTISRKPITFHLPVSDPNWIAISLGAACRSEWPPAGKPWPTKIAPTFQLCNPWSKTRHAPITGLITIEDPRIELRRRLQSLSVTSDGDRLLHAQALISIRDDLSFTPIARFSTVTWSHIVESSDLEGFNLSCARLELTMSFRHSVERHRREDLDCHKIHALLSVLSYQENRSSFCRCVIRVSSQEDWIRKREFLSAQVDRPKGGRVRFLPVPTTSRYDNEASSDIGDNPFDGYLAVAWHYPPSTNIALDLLSGFMDAMCQMVKPKYDPETKSWYWGVEPRRLIDVDGLVSSLLYSELVTDELDAKIFIISSLARCTVWEDLPRADGPIPTPTEHPDTSSSGGSNSQAHSPRQDQPTSSESAPAQRDGKSQTSASTPTDVEQQPPLPSDLPIPIDSTAIQVEQTSTPRTTTVETSRDQSAPIRTPSPGASVAVRAQKDKGKRTATQSVPEHESTFTGRKPVARRRVVVEEGESSRTGARMAEASED